MHRFSLILTGMVLAISWGLHCVVRASAGSTLEQVSSQESEILSQVVQELKKSETGQQLIHTAMSTWSLRTTDELLDRFRLGEASKTDAVLIRHYDSVTGQESRERKVTVYLRAQQPMDDLVLDMAHELVHATSRPAWDPYDPELTPGQYIHAAIEGTGGEVEAVQIECKVSLELYGLTSDSSAVSRCKRYRNSREVESIREDFYRVGKWAHSLRKSLRGELKLFPLLSEVKPTLYSSTGGAPYPVALLNEYRQMTEVACENSKRRVASRAPASSPSSEFERSTLLFLSQRCR